MMIYFFVEQSTWLFTCTVCKLGLNKNEYHCHTITAFRLCGQTGKSYSWLCADCVSSVSTLFIKVITITLFKFHGQDGQFVDYFVDALNIQGAMARAHHQCTI